MILFLHGGGWIINLPEYYDSSNRVLASLSEANLLCIDYRLAPEDPYPAALNDCIDTYHWLVKNAAKKLYCDPDKIAIAGGSAGGNLTAACALKLRDEGKIIQPKALLLICPVSDFHYENYSSYLRLAPTSLFFDDGLMSVARVCYVKHEQLSDPYVSPMFDHLKNLPPTFVLSGDQDPLLDDNKAFVEKLKKAGNPHVKHLIGKGMPHDYYTWLDATKAALPANQAMTKFLRSFLKGDVTSAKSAK